MNEPLVSVVIPAYQASRLLPEALASVAAQTYSRFEVVVVNDGSTDDTTAVARSFAGVRCIEQSHAGAAAARNRGIGATSGDMVAFLDADDIWPSTKLSRQVDHLLDHPDLGIVLGRQQVFQDEVAPRPPGPAPGWFASGSQDQGLVAFATMLAWRHVFATVGLFDDRLATVEDMEWLIRARDAGIAFEILDGVSLHRRVHADNSTSSSAPVRHNLASVLHERIRRGRVG